MSMSERRKKTDSERQRELDRQTDRARERQTQRDTKREGVGGWGLGRETERQRNKPLW